MTWNGKFTGADMVFVAGVLVCLAFVVLGGWAGFLWFARWLVGG